jgi:uncharacterized protein YbaP (TraB family)
MIFELSGSRLRVMGTLHLLPQGAVLPAWVRSGYDWSEAVFIEHSPSEFLRLAQLPDPVAGRTPSPAFGDLLARATVDRASGAPAGLQRGAAVLMALASRIAVAAIGGADQALHDWSRADARPFGYLEQAGDALELLNAIEESEWTPAIHAELARPESPERQLQGFHDAWRKGKLVEIERLSRQGLFASADIRAHMLTRRNQAWAAPYTDPPRRSLVAVGAAHLVGPGNFLECLARVSGRSIRRIV